MPAVYIHSHTVTADDLDRVGHVNNLAYVKWLLDAAIGHASVQGWPPERHLAARTGWVVRSHYIEYIRPAFAGDEIEVQTWVAGFKRVSSIRKYRIARRPDGVLLATAETNWAYVNFDTHAPQRIPPEVAQSFEVMPIDFEPS